MLCIYPAHPLTLPYYFLAASWATVLLTSWLQYIRMYLCGESERRHRCSPGPRPPRPRGRGGGERGDDGAPQWPRPPDLPRDWNSYLHHIHTHINLYGDSLTVLLVHNSINSHSLINCLPTSYRRWTKLPIITTYICIMLGTYIHRSLY